MNIEELLNKYFEGETNCEEERELRRFFTQGIVPEHLQMYGPMFAFFSEENRQSKIAGSGVPKTSVPLRHRLPLPAPASTLHIQRNGCRNVDCAGYRRPQSTFQYLYRKLCNHRRKMLYRHPTGARTGHGRIP